jgi:hypothetical protein
MVHDMQLMHLRDGDAACSGSPGGAVFNRGQTDRMRIRHSTAAPTLRSCQRRERCTRRFPVPRKPFTTKPSPQ